MMSNLSSPREVAKDDLAGQIAQALRNTHAGLRSAGAGFSGVDFLFEPDVLVEVEATAVLD